MKLLDIRIPSRLDSHYGIARLYLFFTWSAEQKKVRFGRFMWGKAPRSNNGGHANKLTFSFSPKRLFVLEGWDKGKPPTKDHWRVHFFGIGLHYRYSGSNGQV